VASILDVLPRPLEELSLADVDSLIANGEETLHLELKEQLDNQALARSCAAFANTFGGLLIVGISDDGRRVGVERPHAEVELFISNVLRSRVLPAPAFRARWLALDGEGTGLLIVLVEESSATPHLLLRSGAIYVRSPGESHPVPLQDQARLFELVRRGERARQSAQHRTGEHVAEAGERDAAIDGETLVVAATGVPDLFRSRLFVREAPKFLAAALDQAFGERPERVAPRQVEWRQDSLLVRRVARLDPSPFSPNPLEKIQVWRDGTLAVHRGHSHDPRSAAHSNEVGTRFRGALEAARRLLAQLGAHGDLDLLYRFSYPGKALFYRSDQAALEMPAEVRVERRTALATIAEADEALWRDVLAELLRSRGVGPIA
jgi:hypothetical protein